MKLAYAVFALGCGMACSFYARRVALYFERAARLVVGQNASVWPVRVTGWTLMLVAGGALVAPLFLLAR